ncbi:hypothetical protein [Legionella longbeachae]|nr:hypothetical protein [Legionella longbeachae]VEE04118.1 Uncharacterised protein [Legionella oakridgensis]HBD7396974.1 hypothetical protein [Legionella pneumophila]ARB93041.1 hypothetical protein A6J40_13025 [Legionella longbeachae]ARM33897.1 hypothetical protein B0B39_10325 [Legionella longbeachae]EEZ96907.1 WAP domain protein [Legionella longbeachae D-4968]
MKTIYLGVSLFLVIGLNFHVYSSSESSAAIQRNMKLYKLAANCPQNCASCWEQCTKDDDCGVGQSCIATACGNRCVKQAAD